MSGRFLFHLIFFFYQIRVQECPQHHCQRNHRAPDRFFRRQITQDRSDHRAQQKIHQHREMPPQLFPMSLIFGVKMLYFLCQTYADLPDMICNKGRRDRYPFCLPECIILHGSKQIDRYLRNLYRSCQRHKSKCEYRQYLNWATVPIQKHPADTRKQGSGSILPFPIPRSLTPCP